MEWQFQAIDANEALSAKHAFVAFLRESCTPKSDCEAAMVVFGELVANVILHAPGSIEITLQSDSKGVVTLDVCDSGGGFILAPSLPSVITALGGRGLYIVSRLCSSLVATRMEGGNKVSAVLPVVAKASYLHLVEEKRTSGTVAEADAGDDDASHRARGASS
ncbi:MAG: ATP-binding protein [Candidatus Tumulicola sp.]